MVHLLALERNRDLLREAQRDRLVRLALAGRKSPEPLFLRALAWLGCRLIIWGQNLQKRGGLEIELPLPPTADCSQHC
jgi:hypothetical protein